MALRVIVDENAGPGTKVWEEFCRLPMFAGGEMEPLFLKDAHPGIPDVEILDKLLGPETILVTGDRVLHMRALERRVRSYTVNEHGQLTRRRLPGVRTSELPGSVHHELRDDYRHQPASDLLGKLKTGFSEKQFKRYRTARRRIHSHFGSAAAISQVSVTVGAKLTKQGLLCGFAFHLAGNSGVRGLQGREGYCRPAHALTDPACAVMHALRDQYLLQLEQVRTDLFIMPPPALELCRSLLAGEAPAEPLHQVLRELLTGIGQLTLHPCTKGRFFDSMNNKLNQLQRGHTNEITTVDFAEVTKNVLGQSLIRERSSD
jgi:hypothetical protein